MMTALDGVVMELQDCALPLLEGNSDFGGIYNYYENPTEIVPTADPAVAFANVDAAILVGSMPRREGMERKDLLQANAKIFEVQGKALDQHAKKTVKVGVIALTRCLVWLIICVICLMAFMQELLCMLAVGAYISTNGEAKLYYRKHLMNL